MPKTRQEQDSLGTVQVPADALYGAQTQRALDNLPFSAAPMPSRFIEAVLMIKLAAIRSHRQLGSLPTARCEAIEQGIQRLLSDPKRQRHFPLSRFQTGSGTSTHMNVNEVIAQRASQGADAPIHPNDDVNLGQSSNDVIPTAMLVSAVLSLQQQLNPALEKTLTVLRQRAEDCTGLVKTGRTHLMDALPIPFSQSLQSWASQLRWHQEGIASLLPALKRTPLGGTAVGTGVNAPEGFRQAVHQQLSALTGDTFTPADCPGALISAIDPVISLSGQLKALATAVVKLCNDLRWMNSGPHAGLNEIRLPALQPGSSIMPGKVNPVVPEAVAMAATEVVGNDAILTLAAQSGNFELNTMLPLAADKLLGSIALLSEGLILLTSKALSTMTVNEAAIAAPLSHNPMLITALAPQIGYEQAAKIAQQAEREGKPILAVAVAVTGLSEAALAPLLSPRRLAGLE